MEKKVIPTVKFGKWNCNVNVLEYAKNKRKALELTHFKTGEPIIMATINIPEEEIEKDEVCIKDYSENEGVLSALIAAKVISEPVKFLSSGFALIPVCKLLIK